MTNPYPLTIALLEKEGIDPSTMIVGSITATGYNEAIVDEDGKRIRKQGSSTTMSIPRTWPNKEFGRLVLDTLQEDLANPPRPVEPSQPGAVDKVVLLWMTYQFDPKAPGAYGRWKAAHDLLNEEEIALYDASVAKVSETAHSEKE